MNLRIFFVLLLPLIMTPILSGCASKPATIISADSPGGDPWFRAARTGDTDSLQKLIEAGRKVDEPNKLGVTALMTASRGGGPELIKWLLEQGADATRVDQDGQSALVYALVGNMTGIKLERSVELLVRAGANPFAIDKLGFQPVQHMLELNLDSQLMKLKYTNKKPCDLLPRRPDEVAISKAARRLEKIALAEFLEAEGCW
jgi:ankyrin repeat protein